MVNFLDAFYILLYNGSESRSVSLMLTRVVADRFTRPQERPAYTATDTSRLSSDEREEWRKGPPGQQMSISIGISVPELYN